MFCSTLKNCDFSAQRYPSSTNDKFILLVCKNLIKYVFHFFQKWVKMCSSHSESISTLLEYHIYVSSCAIIYRKINTEYQFQIKNKLRSDTFHDP